MKTLIAVSSCEAYEVQGINQSMRECWLEDALSLGFDYKFFHGYGATPKEDVVVLGVDDEYWGLTQKLKKKLRWAYDNNYDYVFSCFPDTYARPERLLTCGFEEFDYFGSVHAYLEYDMRIVKKTIRRPNRPIPTNKYVRGDKLVWYHYCDGGAGYFLSRKACLIAAEDPSCRMNDDCWLGDVLESHGGTTRGHSEGFKQHEGFPTKGNFVITAHCSDASHHLDCNGPWKYTAEEMRKVHQLWLDSNK